MRGFAGTAGAVAREAQLAIGGIGIGAATATVAMVHMAESFDQPMRKVFALTGISRDQFESYKKQVLDLSTIVPKSAEDLANGLYFVVSAGFQGADAMQILEASAKAAAAGMTDTKTVADAITSALNAYKLTGASAGDITGKLTQAVIEGKTEFGALAGSIGRVLPIAAAAGVSFDEIMASMATMTRVGLNADEAATALRGTLNALEKPTSKAADEFTKLNLFMDGASFSADKLRAELKAKGLLAVLAELMDATHGNVGELGTLIPNIRALTGVLATAGSQSEQYAAILGREKASGAAAANEAFARTAEGASAQMGILKNNLTAIGITIGDVLLPPLTQVTGQVVAFLKPIREWLSLHPQMTEWIGKGLALVGVLFSLAAGAATMSTAIGVVFSHLGPLGVGITSLSHGLLGILGPIGLVAAAVLALKLAWDNNLGGIQQIVGPHLVQLQAMFTNLQNVLAPVKAAIVDFALSAKAYIEPFVTAAVAALSKFWTEVQPKWAAAWSAISIALTYFWENVLGPVVRAIATFLSEHWNQIIAVLRTAWNVVTDIIRVAWDVISGIFKIALDLLSGNWQAAWTDLSDMVQNIFNDIGRFLHDFFTELVPTVLKLAIGLGQAIVSGILEGLGNLKTAIGNAIGGAVSGAFGAAGAILGNVPHFAGGGVMPYDGLAYVHAGERVLTPSQQRESLSFSGTVSFTLPVYIDGRQVATGTAQMNMDDFLTALRRGNRK